MIFSGGDPRWQWRLMTAEDLPQVLSIEQQCHPYPWSEENFLSSLGSSHHCHVLCHDKAIVAYIITSTAADEAEILNISVTADYRRQGIASHLIAVTCQQFNESIHTVFLEVRASNHSAIALYHSLAFNEVGTRPRYYPADNGREDAIIMAKAL